MQELPQVRTVSAAEPSHDVIELATDQELQQVVGGWRGPNDNWMMTSAGPNGNWDI